MPATAFDRLAPDQRAAVELVLRQGRSYGELSDLLGMPEETIRSRARGGLAALAPDLAAPSRAGEISDWLLGQQSEAHAARTRALLLEDPAAHRWAAEVAAPLREIPGGDAVPALPTGPDAPKPRVNGKRRGGAAARDDAPRGGTAAAAGDPPHNGAAAGDDAARRGSAADDDWLGEDDDAAPASPRDTAPGSRRDDASRHTAPASPRDTAPGSRRDDASRDTAPASSRDDSAPERGASSRLGGALLIGAAVIVVAVVLAFVFTRGGDDPEPAANTPQATPTPSVTAVGSNQFALRGPAGSTSIALVQIFRASDDTVRFAIAAQGVEPNASGERYSIWLTRDNGAPQLLGDVRDAVGSNGQLTAAGPGNDQTDEFVQWLQTYDSMAITLDPKGAKEPGKVILSGPLPRG